MPRNTRSRRRARTEPDTNPAPSPEEIGEAAADFEELTLPGMPDVETVRTLEASGTEAVGPRTLTDAGITDGDPQHGARRSYTHVSNVEIETDVLIDQHISHPDDGEHVPNECPNCGSTKALYRGSDTAHGGDYVLMCANRRCPDDRDGEPHIYFKKSFY